MRRRVHLSGSSLAAWVGFALLAAAVTSAPGTAAADGGDPSLIHACVQKSSQQVRLVAPDGVCRQTETPVHWPGAAGVSPAPLNLTVNCAAGETVASALAQATASTNRVTITIVGTCTEAVTISRDAVTLQGAAPGDGLQAPSPTATVLTVIGQRVELNQLTIAGGARGIAALRGAAFRGTNLRVSGGSSANVFLLQNATGQLTNSIVGPGPRNGVELQLGFSIAIVGGAVEDHGLIGVQPAAGSHASVVGGAALRRNAFRGGMAGNGSSLFVDSVVEDSDIGLQAFVGGTVTLAGPGAVTRNHARFGLFAGSGSVIVNNGARVADNGGVGILVSSGRLTMQTGAVVENNGGGGVEVTAGGAAEFSGGSSVAADGVIIRNNQGDGIHVRDVGVAAFFPIDATAVGATQVTGNTGTGVICDGPPSVAQIRGPVGTVTGNGNNTIACPVSP
jgi:hypothetical protein